MLTRVLTNSFYVEIIFIHRIIETSRIRYYRPTEQQNSKETAILICYETILPDCLATAHHGFMVNIDSNMARVPLIGFKKCLRRQLDATSYLASCFMVIVNKFVETVSIPIGLVV
ncbi:hypothetical protein DICVIV_06050 [Dictyocaulus viviparus]|uniref:Uncharacterized protein n=1 Tax=Dictyocaulus viviparus TaxID=29172 RepID=A0A0D8XTL7_DICVI|nr:hypothetical protein DICVIV_06050 [Dictyocaulus viviparus]